MGWGPTSGVTAPAAFAQPQTGRKVVGGTSGAQPSRGEPPPKVPEQNPAPEPMPQYLPGNTKMPFDAPTMGLPPGISPGTPAWNQWLKDQGIDKRDPMNYFGYINRMAEMMGGFYNPNSAWGPGGPKDYHSTGNDLWNAGKSRLDEMGLLNPNIRDVHYNGPNVSGAFNPVFGTVTGAGDQYGMKAAGMIRDQPVRSMGQYSSELNAISPYTQKALGAAGTELDRMQSDMEAGYGMIGIPKEMIDQLGAWGLESVATNQRNTVNQMNDQLAAAGLTGQGGADQALAAEIGGYLAPATVSAIQDPWEKAYELGQSEFNSLTGAVSKLETPLTEMAFQGNQSDLERSLKGDIARSNVYGDIMGRSIQSGANAAGDITKADMGYDLEAQKANQGADLDTWSTLLRTMAPNAFGADTDAFNMLMKSGGMSNDLVMQVIQEALGQHRAAEGNHIKDESSGGNSQTLPLIGDAVGGALSGAGSILGPLLAGML